MQPETFERAKAKDDGEVTSKSSLPDVGVPLSLVLNLCSLFISLVPNPEESPGFQTPFPQGVQVTVGAGDSGRG